LSLPLRILFVAYAVPPSPEVGVIRVANFCKYLPEFGVEPVILTVDSRFYGRLDRTFSLPAATRVVQTTQDSTALDWYAKWKSGGANSAGDGERSKSQPAALRSASNKSLRQHVISALTIPDQYRGWYGPAVRAGRELLRAEKIDAILSTSPPVTAQRVASRLKSEFGIPWIIDFRDPWVAEEPSGGPSLKWRKKLDARLEANCVKLADLIFCNTDAIRNSLKERFPDIAQDRFVTLTNGFGDVQAPAGLSVRKNAPLLCLHLGGIYGGRRIDTFCSAISTLVQERKLDPTGIKILFIGQTDEAQISACRGAAGELVRGGTIEFRPRIDKEEAARVLWEADLLLVFQGPHRLQIPLKFYEYLSTGKPVFGVSQPGALRDVISETAAGVWVNDENPAEIGEAFLRAMGLPARTPESIQAQWAGQFHFRNLSGTLAQWIGELAHRAQHSGKSASR
jgi:glycosyltransferase involved in cell wall biosynthesis